jgi:hypothetical protein
MAMHMTHGLAIPAGAVRLRPNEPARAFPASGGGDGVLAYFGYPAAHEDDAERAVRAGLEVNRRDRCSQRHRITTKCSHRHRQRAGASCKKKTQ